MSEINDKNTSSQKIDTNTLLENKLINEETNNNNPSESISKQIIINKEISMPLINKDDYLEKLELTISDYKKDLAQLKMKNNELNDKLIENNEMLEKYELENSIKENENSKAFLILENKVNNLTKEKNELENKTKELILIINQYSSELKDLSNKNKLLNEENKNFYTQNLNLNENLKEKITNLNDMQSQNEQLNEIVSENNKKDEIIEEQKKEIEKIKNEFENKIKNQEELIKEINDLKSQIVENEEIKKKYENISGDLLSTQNNFKDIQNINEINLKRAEDNENALNLQTININKNIVNLIERINNFFDEEIHIDTDIENNIPLDNENEKENNNIENNENEIPYLINIENIKFNLLLECLQNKKINIQKYIQNLIIKNNKLEKEIKEYIIKLTEYDKENNELNKQNEILSEEKNKLINEINTLRNYLNEINETAINNEKENELLKTQIFTINQDKNSNYNINISDIPYNPSIDNPNNKYSDNITIQLMKEEINNLKNENKNLNDTKQLLEKELDNIKNNNFNNYIYDNLLYNNEDEKIKMDLVVDKYNKKLFIYENENNNLKFENQLLKEKLKGAQKKLSENNENTYNNSFIQKLDIQKDSLINDNALLLNKNKYLKNEFNNLNNKVNKIKYGNNYSKYSMIPNDENYYNENQYNNICDNNIYSYSYN